MSFRYYNQSAPFWDFVANLEEQGSSHPLFTNHGGNTEGNNNETPNPWTQGWAGFPWGQFPHRPRHGWQHPHQGPPPPARDGETAITATEKERAPEAGPSEPRDAPGEKQAEEDGARCGPGARRGSRCGGRGRGAAFGRGRGGWGGPPRGFPMHGFGAIANMFQDQFAPPDANKDSEDFKPEVDIFDTPESFVVHVSLPGAKKEDIGVNWDAEKSEVSIAGVVYRPGDEDFLKTLAMDERKIGAFERKVRLGSRANPAQVDVDAITARMEDGVLTVEVPKLDSGYVEIKKVDIE